MRNIELLDSKSCTGCGACYNICPKSAIAMEVDSEGFKFPIVKNNNCIECGLCKKVCPVLQRINIAVGNERPISVYAGYIKDIYLRKRSSSGGAFPAFANYFYSIDNGIVSAACFDDHLNLIHILSSNSDDLRKFQGSKYVQSDTGLVYRDLLCELQKGKRVLFVGTPCQVAGLKTYLRHDYDNLLTVDLVCHGVPSPKLFHTYLEQIGISTKSQYRNFFFRNCENSAYFNHSVLSKDGKLTKVDPSKHSFICAYLSGWLHRESCYHCAFAAVPRQGDCTIADFWGILGGKVPFKGDSSRGVSMIMINNEKGQRVFESIKPSLYLESKTYEEALIDNHNLTTHDIRPNIRDHIYNELMELTPEQFMEKYKLHLYLPPTLLERIKSKFKRTFKS